MNYLNWSSVLDWRSNFLHSRLTSPAKITLSSNSLFVIFKQIYLMWKRNFWIPEISVNWTTGSVNVKSGGNLGKIWLIKHSFSFVILFNWIILRLGFLIWELIFCPHLGSCFLGFFCVISRFTTFRPNFTSGLLQVIFTVTSDRNDESAFHSCCLSHHVCDRQKLWKAVITGNTVTRLIIPIRGRGKNHLKKARGEIWPKRSETRNKTQKKKLPRWGQKVRNK